MTQGRKNIPVTVTLSPEALEGAEVLQGIFAEKKRSPVVDRLIRAEMRRQGFTLRSEDTTMFRLVTAELISGDNSFFRNAMKPGDPHIYYEVPSEGSFFIRLQNKTLKRKLAVVSVDGMNVIDGSDASFDGCGWVLDPGAEAIIKGWKRDNQEAAAFCLQQGVGGSYAEKMGKGAGNVGIVGVAVFDEKKPVQASLWTQSGGGAVMDSYSPFTCSSDGGGVAPMSYVPPSATLASASVPRNVRRSRAKSTQSVGTSYGERIAQQTRTVTFNRCDSPVSQVLMRYGTTQDLVSWGILLASLEPAPSQPSAFPGEAACAAPPGWNG